MISARCLFVILTCLALPGCYVKTYGVGTAGGGVTSTTISTQTGATASFSGGRATFLSGQSVSPSAPGGQVSYGRGGAAIAAVSFVIVDAVYYLGALFGARPGPEPRTDNIADTCSCYQKPKSSEQ